MEGDYMVDNLTRILAKVREERVAQVSKWGVQRHDFSVWMTILGEEFGEVCQSLLDARRFPDSSDTHKAALLSVRDELIQVAAVAVAIVEHIDEELDIA
jgi:NTP pyrophosphatase (non-canonical NTP hydrolase)